jgi:uncharacterized repeat protein (TIGR01451 family)
MLNRSLLLPLWSATVLSLVCLAQVPLAEATGRLPILLADQRDFRTESDRIHYDVTLCNTGLEAATGVRFTESPSPPTRLIPGSVTSDQGRVTEGNLPGATTVAVDIDRLEVNACTTLHFEVALQDRLPNTLTEIRNQGRVQAREVADILTNDPDSAQVNDATITPLTGDGMDLASLGSLSLILGFGLLLRLGWCLIRF